jgi:hypothetical protein
MKISSSSLSKAFCRPQEIVFSYLDGDNGKFRRRERVGGPTIRALLSKMMLSRRAEVVEEIRDFSFGEARKGYSQYRSSIHRRACWS